MSKHTTGPWKVQHECGRHYSIRKDGYWIGRCSGAENAQMIAAAPEMLHALVMMRDADEDCKRDGLQTIPHAARVTIDRAIAKATGETK